MFRELARTVKRDNLTHDFLLDKTPGPIARCAFFLCEKLFDAVIIQRGDVVGTRSHARKFNERPTRRQRSPARLSLVSSRAKLRHLSMVLKEPQLRSAMLHFARNRRGLREDLPDVRLRLFRCWETRGFPGFKAASHGARIFVAHFFQAFGRKRGPSPSAAMTNDHCVFVGDFLFDIELDRSATHVSRIRNMFPSHSSFSRTSTITASPLFDFAAASVG